ncbi:nitrogenase component 1 [Schwartzia sp. (in: firmicutes)]
MAIEAKRVLKCRRVASCSCTMTGVWRALCYVDGAVVIYHSPRACAHIARRMDASSFCRLITDAPEETKLRSIPLLSTDLTDEEAVFGGEERLRRAVRYAYEKYNPQAVFIANSCVSGVIGDDTGAVAEEMTEELGIPVIETSHHGFLDGEYFDGYLDAARILMQRFMKPQKKIPGTVLIFGDCGGIFGAYTREMRRMLDYFGLKISGQFPSYMSLAELEKAPSAALTVVIGRSESDVRQQHFAAVGREFSEKFNIPCFSELYPVGYLRTMEWLKRFGEFLGMEAAAAEAVKKEHQRFMAVVDKSAETLRGKKVVYCAGRATEFFQPQTVLLMLEKLGMKLIGIQLFESQGEEGRQKNEAKLRQYTDAPVLSGEDFEKAVRESDVVLTTHELVNSEVRQVILPCVAGAGWTGEKAVMDAMVRVMHRALSRGGLIYA